MDNASNIENFDDGGVTLRQTEGDDDDSDMKIYVKGETYIPRHQSRKYGKNALKATSFRERVRRLSKKVKTTFERLTVLDENAKIVEDYGVETLGKDILTDNPRETCDDTTFVDAEKGIFAVFDGAGGVGKAGVAAKVARMAADGMRDFVASRTPKNSEDLGQILTSLSRKISREGEKGVTTAVVGRIGVRNGKRTLSYASAGDSRIYVVRRDGEVEQITEDEAIGGKTILNGLGFKNFTMTEKGEVELEKGDMVLFCSDGITGDTKDDRMSNEEIAGIFRSRAKSKNRAQATARALAEEAKKIDDRTAIVVDVK